MDKEKKENLGKNFILAFASFVFILFLIFSVIAVPVGPDTLTSISNSTKVASGAKEFNISGGNIATFNLSARIQDPRWKGFVGNVTGSFTLDDASGSTLYDWQLSTLTGKIYSTRNGSTIDWSAIKCANLTTLNAENSALNLTDPNDNLNQTFNLTGSNPAFYVGSVPIAANSCPTLNTYVNGASQTNYFYEMALYTDPSIVYATIMEPGSVGYNGEKYDFQAIVPDNGSPGFSGSTAYYLYIELGS